MVYIVDICSQIANKWYILVVLRGIISQDRVPLVKVLGTEMLDKASRAHRDLASPIATWITIARGANWRSLNQVRQTWGNTDCVKGQTIFNIKGNKYRLIATVNYESQTIIVKDLIAHAEYTKRGWNK